MRLALLALLLAVALVVWIWVWALNPPTYLASDDREAREREISEAVKGLPLAPLVTPGEYTFELNGLQYRVRTVRVQ